MQVNGEMITEEEVIELLPQIYDLCLPENNDIPATFFEITTALAFLFFAKRGVDVVVLETGTFFSTFFFREFEYRQKEV
jgi:dihydrofolate synthase/folylpolyglutamate synthase